MARKIGAQTYLFDKDISILETGNIVGPMEGKGPLGDLFDKVLDNDEMGMDSFEKAETEMLLAAYDLALIKAKLNHDDLDIYIGGDLLNQIIATSFAMKEVGRPYWGVYSACSTFSEAIQIGATAIEAGVAQKIMASASSHFSSAERQYRTPLEQGSQNPVTSQRTVTAAGCMILAEDPQGPVVSAMTIGKITDYDIKDVADMGTAMAPAAAATILAHFKDTNTSFDDYDMVLTGDLACVGYDILEKLLETEGYFHKGKYNDCGKLIFDKDNQAVDCGGSGAGCSPVVFSAYVFPKLKKREINRLLFVPTGALLSPLSSFQKQSIPCIAHAIVIENKGVQS